MRDERGFNPSIRLLMWVSALFGLFLTMNNGWETPLWEGGWGYVGIVVGFLWSVLFAVAVTFLVLLILREIVNRSRRTDG